MQSRFSSRTFTRRHIATSKSDASRARNMRPWRGAAAALAALLAACGPASPPGDTQVAAKVGTSEISVHQVEEALRHDIASGSEDGAAQRRRLLDNLVEQELAAQGAHTDGLDQSPGVVQALALAHREVLARSHQDRVALQAAPPSDADIDHFYAAQPALFAQRRLYVIREFAVDAPAYALPRLQALARQARSADELGKALEDGKVTFHSRLTARAAEDLEAPVLDAVSRLGAGQSLVLQRNGGALIVTVIRVDDAPLDKAGAKPLIANYLVSERRRAAVIDDMRTLRAKAQIEYFGVFAAPAAPQASAPAPLPSAAVENHDQRFTVGSSVNLGGTGAAAASTPGRLCGPPATAAAATWDRFSVMLLAGGLAALYLPTFWDLTQGIWKNSSHGQEPVIVAICGWLVHRRREAFAALPRAASQRAGGVLLGVGLLIYVLGRTQAILRFELGSMLVVTAAIALYLKGWRGVGTLWFVLLFMVFAIPLPNEVVVALTAPLKAAVSASAVGLLSLAGYSAGRSGVVMTVGQYQLLVTEACAGLQTMFTLEAVGLLYANVVDRGSALRNGLLALLVIPVSFLANTVRVVILALVTCHFGDAAGQGFIHGFAGLVLFGVALALLMAVDWLLGCLLRLKRFTA